MNTCVTVQTYNQLSRITTLRKELKQLKDLLLKKDLEKIVNDRYIEAAINLTLQSVICPYRLQFL